MKIVNFALYTSVRSVRGFGTRRSIILHLTDDAENSGLGEVAPLKGRSIESFDESLQALLEVRKRLLCSDFSPFPLPPSVLFGLNSALLDLSNSQDKIEFETCHLAYVNDKIIKGIENVKIKASECPIETDAYIRIWIASGAKVRVDVNAKWDFDSTVEFANKFSRDEIIYLEDPVEMCEINYFTEKCQIPVAIDCALRSVPIKNVLSKKIAYVVLKPSILGGTDQCREIVKAANDSGIKCVFSSSYETVIGLSHVVRMGKSLGTSMPFGVDTIKLFDKSPKSKCSSEASFIKGLVKPFNTEDLINNELLSYS